MLKSVNDNQPSDCTIENEDFYALVPEPPVLIAFGIIFFTVSLYCIFDLPLKILLLVLFGFIGVILLFMIFSGKSSGSKKNK